jgi:hypothetical protein
MLFIITLSASIFSFSGRAQSETTTSKTTQTEKLISSKVISVRRVVTLRIPFVTPLSDQQVSREPELYALNSYNKLLRVKFDHLTKQVYSFPGQTYLLLPKTIPSNSVEHLPSVKG